MGYLIAAALMAAFLVAKLQLGEWATLATVVLVILVHEAAHWVFARWFRFDTPEFTIGVGNTPKFRLFRFWHTDFFITPWLIGGSVEFDANCDTCSSKPGWQRLIVGASGLIANFMLALVVMFALFATAGEQHVVPAGISVLSVVGKQSPAAQAGLKPGDQIVSVDGVAVKTFDDLHGVLTAHKGAPSAVVIHRQGQTLNFSLRPDVHGRIGVKLDYKVTTTYQKMPPLAAAVRAWQVVADMGASFLGGVLMLLHIMPVPAGATPGSGAVHGLLSIVQLGGIAFAQGPYSFLRLLATVSVTLALCNLIPAPMFDGGHLLFYAWEKLTGKPVPRWLRKRLTRICFWIVVAFMIYATYNDIFHPVA